MAEPIWDRRGAEEEEAESLRLGPSSPLRRRRHRRDRRSSRRRHPATLDVGKIDTGIPKEHWEKVLGGIDPTLLRPTAIPPGTQIQLWRARERAGRAERALGA